MASKRQKITKKQTLIFQIVFIIAECAMVLNFYRQKNFEKQIWLVT